MTREHVSIITPDERGRFNLRRWLGRDPQAHWKVFYDGHRFELEPTENPVRRNA